MKILILGHKRSGKDTAAEFWRDYFGLSFKSSSEMANELFIYNELKVEKGYKTIQECFEDRVNNRSLWYDMIVKYNQGQNRLTKEILKVSDCYVGMRDLEEFNTSKHLFGLVIWIDANERVEAEDGSSMNIPIDVADIVIRNNKSLIDFEYKLITVGERILKGIK